VPDDLANLLDSTRLRDVAYVVVAGLTIWAFVSERRLIGRDPGANASIWPSYWLVTAGVVLAMAFGRAGLADIVTEIGREQALERNWYEARREVQVVAVGLIGCAWFVAVVLAIWRVPPRRRRYLPNVLAVATLVALAAVRLISLHHIDALLYRTDIGGVRFVAFAELGILAGTVITIVWALVVAPPANPPVAAGPPDPVG